MPIFLVERYLDPAETARLGRRLCDVASGGGVVWLGSIVLAAEDACLCLFRAECAADVVAANELAAAGFDRVVDASLLGGLEADVPRA
jgi:hypothetical protein